MIYLNGKPIHVEDDKKWVEGRMKLLKDRGFLYMPQEGIYYVYTIDKIPQRLMDIAPANATFIEDMKKQDFKVRDNCTLYMPLWLYEKHIHDFAAIYNYLMFKLKGVYRIDFNNISNAGISVSVAHVSDPIYYRVIKTIKYDFSNANDIIKLIVHEWENYNEE